MRFDSYTSNSILHILRIFFCCQRKQQVFGGSLIFRKEPYMLPFSTYTYSFRWVLRATKEAWDEMCVCIGVLSKKWRFPDFPTGLSMTYYDYRWGYCTTIMTKVGPVVGVTAKGWKGRSLNLIDTLKKVIPLEVQPTTIDEVWVIPQKNIQVIVVISFEFIYLDLKKPTLMLCFKNMSFEPCVIWH